MDKLKYIWNEVNPITGIPFDSAMWLLESYEQKLVENQDLTVLCKGLGSENEQLRERNEELLKMCGRRAKKIFKLEKELKEETEENEVLNNILKLNDENERKFNEMVLHYSKIYFEKQLNEIREIEEHDEEL